MKSVKSSKAGWATMILLVLCSLWMPFVTLAQSPRNLPSEKLEQIERTISSTMSRLNIPGLSVSVVSDNQLLWEQGFGMADLENFVPAKASTVYRLASVSKPITAAAVMQLVEKGKINLDDPIQKYVPAFPQKDYPITVRQLLTHTSGVRHYKGDEFDSTHSCKNLSEALEVFKNDPLEHKPGEKITYSTYGYTLLGLAVESASGMRFIDYLQENIFKPAGMTHTRADVVADIIINRTEGYAKNEKGDLRNANLADTSCKIPGGGLVSTVEDIAKFAIAIQNGTLIKKETFVLMSTNQYSRELVERTIAPQKLPPDADLPRGYGFGWTTKTEKRKDAVWHGGAGQGLTSIIYLLPKEKFAIAIMMNLEGQGDEITNLADQIAEIVLQ